MTDLWTEASYDHEQEAADRSLALAKVASQGIFQFLSLATNETEFAARLALAEGSISKVAEDTGNSVESVTDLLKRQHALLVEATQETCAKEGSKTASTEGYSSPYYDDKDDDDDQSTDCPMCGGEAQLMGQLGNRKHYRCRDCGWDSSKKAKTAASDEDERNCPYGDEACEAGDKMCLDCRQDARDDSYDNWYQDEGKHLGSKTAAMVNKTPEGYSAGCGECTYHGSPRPSRSAALGDAQAHEHQTGHTASIKTGAKLEHTYESGHELGTFHRKKGFSHSLPFGMHVNFVRGYRDGFEDRGFRPEYWQDVDKNEKTSGKHSPPVAYTYEADVHCPECTKERFGKDLDNATDSEGNQVHPVAPWDEMSPEGEYCGTCGNEISEPYKTSAKKTAEYHYIRKGDNGKYEIWQKGTGKTLSTHDTKEDAEAAFRAMEMNMHSSKTALNDAELSQAESEWRNGLQAELDEADANKDQTCEHCGHEYKGHDDDFCPACGGEQGSWGEDHEKFMHEGHLRMQAFIEQILAGGFPFDKDDDDDGDKDSDDKDSDDDSDDDGDSDDDDSDNPFGDSDDDDDDSNAKTTKPRQLPNSGGSGDQDDDSDDDDSDDDSKSDDDNDDSDSDDGGNPFAKESNKINEIALSVLTSNPTMKVEEARGIARRVVASYPVIAETSVFDTGMAPQKDGPLTKRINDAMEDLKQKGEDAITNAIPEGKAKNFLTGGA